MNRYLEGNYAPVATEVTAFDLPVTGVIPPELDGRLLRNGPNPITVDDPDKYHWFSGDAMVHGLRLRDGKAQWYRNRWVLNDHVADRLGRTRVGGPRYGLRDLDVASNTHVIAHAGRTLALVEAGGPIVVLDDELGTAAYTDFEGTLGDAFTAHTKLDPATGELHAVAYFPMWQDKVCYIVVGKDGTVVKTVDVDVPGSPMIHDLAITERYACVLDLPVAFDFERVVAGLFPFGWKPERPAWIGLVDRTDAGVAWFEIEPCYVYHTVNACDRADGTVTLDAVRYASAMTAGAPGPADGDGAVTRWTLDPASGKCSEERLDDRVEEFPRIDERLNGRPSRYGYSVAVDERDDFVDFPAAYKRDYETGAVERHDYGSGRATGELVFVPRSDDAGEDDGYLLSYVYDKADDVSDVVILDAGDFAGEPIATIRLPQRVPYGFHGSWAPTR